MIEELPMTAPPPRQTLLERRIDITQVNPEWIAYGVLIVFSVLIHLWNLGAMAMAHDESIHAWASWRFFVGRGGFDCAGGRTAQTYCYDPVYHGPTLYFLTAASYFLFGVSDTTARLPQAFSGIALIPAVYMLRPLIGKRMAFLSAVLVTLSPSMLYFARYARHDAIMLLWTLVMFGAFFLWVRSGRPGHLILAAFALAVAWATHELIFILLFIGGTFLIFRLLWEWRPVVRGQQLNLFVWAVTFGIAVSVAIVTASRLLGTDTPLYRNVERLLGPALMAGVGSLLVLAISRTWPAEPVLLNRLRATWASRGNAAPERSRTLMGYVPATVWWALLAFLVTFGLLFSTFLAYPRGFLDGFYQGIKYWWGSQHDYARGAQPWYYYLMLLPIYDLMAFIFTIVGICWLAFGGSRATALFKRVRQARGGSAVVTYDNGIRDTDSDDVDLLEQNILDKQEAKQPAVVTTTGQRIELFISFLAYWSVLSLVAFSWAGEKMPWLLIQISLPMTLLAAWVLTRLSRKVDWALVQRNYGWSIPLLTTLALALGGVSLFFLTGGGDTTSDMQSRLRALPALGMFGVVIFGIVTVAGNVGWRNLGRVTALTFAGLLLLYGVNSAVQVVYDHPDTPVEPLIYTQTSPDVPVVMDQIRRMSIAQTRNDRSKEDPAGGLTMKIAVDGKLAWPFQWYLRDYRSVTWLNLDDNEPTGLDAPVVLLQTNQETAQGGTRIQAVREDLATTHVKLSDGVFNWWFPEGAAGCDTGYASDPANSCAYKDIGKRGPLGVILWPFQPSNWGTLARFMVYREIPHQLTGRDFEFYVATEAAPVAGGGTTTSPSAANVTQDMQIAATWGVGELSGPRGMTVDAAGNTYVADSFNHRIVVFDPQGMVLRTFGTKGGGDGQLYEPSGVAVDEDGNIYVADTWNARIAKFSSDGTWITSWGSGRDDFGEGRRATDTQGEAQANTDNPLGFYGPRNVLVVGNNVYIADTGNKRIVVTDRDGNFVEQWGTWGAQPGQFHEPIGLGTDAQGRIYVGDTWNGRVQIFNRTDDRVVTDSPTTVRVSGWEANTYNDPYMAVAPDGRILVSLATRNAVGVYSADGTLEARLRADTTAMTTPKGLAVAADGSAFVVDGDGKLLKFQLP